MVVYHSQTATSLFPRFISRCMLSVKADQALLFGRKSTFGGIVDMSLLLWTGYLCCDSLLPTGRTKSGSL